MARHRSPSPSASRSSPPRAATTTTTTPRRHRGAGRRRRPATEPTATEPTDTAADTDGSRRHRAGRHRAGRHRAGSRVDPASVDTDFGVDDDTIRIGLNADLSGIFAPLVTQIVEAQEAYWEIVNENGGIAGRQVELVILDNGYDVPTHLENYEEMSGDERRGRGHDQPVDRLAAHRGHRRALVEDDLIAIPLSWYSGWADPAIGENVLEI